MKILLLADSLDIGGAETHIYELSRALFSYGHEVKLFCFGGRTAERLKKCGIDVIEKNGLLELTELLRAFKPHVIHAHTRKSLLLAQAATRLIDIPIVFTAHASFKGGIKRLFTRLPCRTIAVSRDIKEHMVKCFSADRDRVEVIENGIDTECFNADRHDGIGLRILNVSRLDSDCSHAARLLCTAAPDLASILPLQEIVIVGGGDGYSQVAELARCANKKIGREVIHLAGAQGDVLPYIKNCNIFVGVSRAALEAMSCRRAVIICGGEGYFGVCKREDFEGLAEGNFCARGEGMADAKRLCGDIEGAFSALESSELYMRDLVCKRFGTDGMAKRNLKQYIFAAEEHRQKNAPYAVVCGYYGFGNLGDELVGEKISSLLGCERVKTVGAFGKGRRWRFDLFGVIKDIKNCSLLVFGGGSLLQNSTSNRSLYYYSFLLRLSGLFGRPTAVYANGIGPLVGKRAVGICKKALRYVDRASVRDGNSLKLLNALAGERTQCLLSCDPALESYLRMPKKGRVAVFLRGEDCDREFLYFVKQAVLGLISEAPKLIVVFGSMNKKRDSGAVKKLAESMAFTEGVFEPKGKDELFEFVSGCDMVISGRLHALVAAASAGVPFVALCRDPKLYSFASECGAGEFAVSDMSLLEETVKKAYRRRHELSALITEAVDIMLKRGEGDRAFLNSFLLPAYEDKAQE